MGGAEDPLPMEGTASLFVRVVAMPSVVVARDATGDAVDGTTTADLLEASPEDENTETENDENAEETPEATTDITPREDDDPTDQSITIRYELPNDTEFSSGDFEIPVTKQSGTSIPVKWAGDEKGHLLAVNEVSLRAIAKRPKVVFTITREAPFIVAQKEGLDEGDDATPNPESTDRNADLVRGAPIVSVVEVDLVNVILGSARTCFLRLGEGGKGQGHAPYVQLPMPAALAGFGSVTLAVSLDAFTEQTQDQNETTETEPPKFLPPGLAKHAQPFSVTVDVVSRLPDQPASVAELARCESVTACMRWAGLPVGELVGVYGAHDWRPASGEGGESDPSFHASKSYGKDTPSLASLSKKTRAYATAKPTSSSSSSSRLHTRNVTFGTSAIWFGIDVDKHKYPGGLKDVCLKEKIEVRLYDRFAPNEPTPFSVDGGSDEGVDDSTKQDHDGDESSAPGDPSTTPNEDESEATRNARETAEFEKSSSSFPPIEVYGVAFFEARDFGVKSSAPKKVFPKVSLERQIKPSAMRSSTGPSWRTRPGRFLEAETTVCITVQMAVHPAESLETFPSSEAVDESSSETVATTDAADGASKSEADGLNTPPTGSEDKKKIFDASCSGRQLPFIRATCTFPSDDLQFTQEVLRAVRLANAGYLRSAKKGEKQNPFDDDDVLGDDAKLRFFLSNEQVTETQACDADGHFITGYHVVDGDFRQITVEGTRRATDAVRVLFANKRRVAVEKSFVEKNDHSKGTNSSGIEPVPPGMQPASTVVTVMNHSCGYSERAYRELAGFDLFCVRTRSSVGVITGEHTTHLARHLVRPEARICLTCVSALLQNGTKARQALDQNLYPTSAQLIALDRTFGTALVVDDISADAPESRKGVERSPSRDVDPARSDIRSDVDPFRAIDASNQPGHEANRVGKHPSLDDPFGSGLFAVDTIRSTSRVRQAHEPLATSNSQYLATLQRKRELRNTQDVHEAYKQKVRDLYDTTGEKARLAWGAWNVRRPDRNAFETEIETAKRHATASAKPVSKEAVSKNGQKQFKWPVAHVASERRVPESRRLSQSRVHELREPWDEPDSNHFSTKYFASKYFPGGALDSTKQIAAERRTDGGEGTVTERTTRTRDTFNTANTKPLPSQKPFVSYVGRDVFFGEHPERASLWYNREGEKTTTETDTEKRWRDVTVPRMKRPAQTDKTRGVLHNVPVKKGLTGKCVKGLSSPARNHSMFLQEPPTDLRGLSLDETFSRSLRRDAGGIFVSNAAAETLSTRFTHGKDFVRHNVGDKTLKHTARKAGVGEVARAAPGRRSAGVA